MADALCWILSAVRSFWMCSNWRSAVPKTPWSPTAWKVRSLSTPTCATRRWPVRPEKSDASPRNWCSDTTATRPGQRREQLLPLRRIDRSGKPDPRHRQRCHRRSRCTRAQSWPCVRFDGYEQFQRLRTKLDGCITGCQLAKDRAAESLIHVMIPAALDYLNNAMDRPRMDVDIVCAGFGPAAGGFLTRFPADSRCLTVLFRKSFVMNGLTTSGSASRASSRRPAESANRCRISTPPLSRWPLR